MFSESAGDFNVAQLISGTATWTFKIKFDIFKLIGKGGCHGKP
jgi:hypothetical protein